MSPEIEKGMEWGRKEREDLHSTRLIPFDCTLHSPRGTLVSPILSYRMMRMNWRGLD